MIELKVTFDKQRFRNALETATMKSLVSQIQQRVGSVRCAEHGKTPSVHIEGTSLQDLRFKIDGCCQTVIDQVRAKLPVKT